MLNLSTPTRMLALATASLLATVNGVVSADGQPLVEVFTTSEVPIITGPEVDRVEIYNVDGIRRLEEEISRGLSRDASTARQQAIARVTQLEEDQKQQVRRTATGLSKAMQYEIDRTPAILFDGEAVVYGLTDLGVALDHYRTWRAGARP